MSARISGLTTASAVPLRPVGPAASADGKGCTEVSIPVAGERMIAARRYGRRIGRGPTPLVLHFHGGAFVSGTLQCGATIAHLLADAGAIVLSIDYPLAPENPFPQAAETGHAVLTWLYRHRRRLGGDGSPLLVAGEEAGGNLAAAVTLMARDRQQPPLAGQILLSPMLDPSLGTASQRDGADPGAGCCPFANGWSKYLPRISDADHPYASPGASMRLTQLPPTLLLTAADDPLRDETLAYAVKLRKAGVPVAQAVIETPTGWPRSFTQRARIDCAEAQADWTISVRDHFRRFMLQLFSRRSEVS